MKTCPCCGSPLMKIDHYGEVLIGCLECNYWRRPGDKRSILEMVQADLEALRASVRKKHRPHAESKKKAYSPDVRNYSRYFPLRGKRS